MGKEKQIFMSQNISGHLREILHFSPSESSNKSSLPADSIHSEASHTKGLCRDLALKSAK